MTVELEIGVGVDVLVDIGPGVGVLVRVGVFVGVRVGVRVGVLVWVEVGRFTIFIVIRSFDPQRGNPVCHCHGFPLQPFPASSNASQTT